MKKTQQPPYKKAAVKLMDTLGVVEFETAEKNENIFIQFGSYH